MFTNGHKLIMDMGVDAVAHPLLRERYDELLLGNMREDVYKFPFARRFMLGKGLTHYYRPGRPGGAFRFVPGAPARADWLFDGAVREWRAGHPRDAFFTLGRVVHLLSEMVAPVHAQVILHWRGDGFEMVLERDHQRLRALPLPSWPTPPPQRGRPGPRAGGLLPGLPRRSHAQRPRLHRLPPGPARAPVGRHRRAPDRRAGSGRRRLHGRAVRDVPPARALTSSRPRNVQDQILESQAAHRHAAGDAGSRRRRRRRVSPDLRRGLRGDGRRHSRSCQSVSQPAVARERRPALATRLSRALHPPRLHDSGRHCPVRPRAGAALRLH